MSTIDIHRVLVLPETLEAHSLYIVKAQKFGFAELVFTDKDGEQQKVIDSIEVETMMAAMLAKSPSVEIVSDIASLNALELERRAIVYVVDASADESVGAGSALYSYEPETESYRLMFRDYKADENIQVKWGNILGGPTASPEAIDIAVENSHTHGNADVLNELSEVDGVLQYKGKNVAGLIIKEVVW